MKAKSLNYIILADLKAYQFKKLSISKHFMNIQLMIIYEVVKLKGCLVMKKNQQDFTQGNILKQLVIFSGPLILASLLQTSYQLSTAYG